MNVCIKRCPGSLLRFDGTLEVCSERGECDDGNSGTGYCECEPNSGYGASRKQSTDGTATDTIQTVPQVDCADCDTTHFGDECNHTCPGIVTRPALVFGELQETLYACSKKGTCKSGHYGSGECLCEDGYWTYNCSQEVPGGAPGVTTAVLKLDLDYSVYLMMANFELQVATDLGLRLNIHPNRVSVSVSEEIQVSNDPQYTPQLVGSTLFPGMPLLFFSLLFSLCFFLFASFGLTAIGLLVLSQDSNRRSLQSGSSANDTSIVIVDIDEDPKAIVTFTILKSIGAVTFTAEDIQALLPVGISVSTFEVLQLEVTAAGPCFGHGVVNRYYK